MIVGISLIGIGSLLAFLLRAPRPSIMAIALLALLPAVGAAGSLASAWHSDYILEILQNAWPGILLAGAGLLVVVGVLVSERAADHTMT